MTKGKLFSVSKFAELSRTTRDTLHHYDKIGLLIPARRGANNYRYYSSAQLAVVNLIRTLQELGMPLAEIKNLKDRRSPESINELLAHHITQIDAKMEMLSDARKLLLTLQKSIHAVLDVDERAITIQSLPRESIILGGLNDYSRDANDYDALLEFYNATNAQYPDLDLNYPVWGTFSEEQLKRGAWTWPTRYYFYNPEGRDSRPAAQYAVGYTRGGYGQSDELFARLLDYIDKNGFEICGPAYKEYPLNEICISNDTNYLIRVLITVREREGCRHS